MSEQEILEAVLVGGVVLDNDGDAWQKREDGWYSAGPKQSSSAWSDADLASRGPLVLLREITSDLAPDLAQVERQRSVKAIGAEDAQTPPMVQCPASTETSDIVGCGRLVPDVRDEEGFVDCPRCGIWFDPEREKHGAVSPAYLASFASPSEVEYRAGFPPPAAGARSA